MKTSWKTLGRSLSSDSAVKKSAIQLKREKESIEDDGRSGISRSCTTWLCVIGGKTCEAWLAQWVYFLGQDNQP